MRVTSLVACLSLAVLGGCEEDPVLDPDLEPVSVGFVAPNATVIPPLADAANAFLRVAETAVAEVNARGGINRRELVLVPRDSGFDPPTRIANGEFPLATDIIEVINEYDSLGVVGFVGPVVTATASQAWQRANELDMPIISPSSTGVDLTQPLDPDTGVPLEDKFLFRNATDDRFQGLAMAHFLTNLYDDPATAASPDPVECAYILHDNDGYGNGFSAAVVELFQEQLGNTLKLVRPLGAEEGCDLACDIQAVADAPPCDEATPNARRNVILISFGAAGDTVATWDQMDPRPDILWFLTDGARTSGFVSSAPESIDGVVGTSRTNPVIGDAYEVFEDAYEDRFPEENIAETAYTAQVWDGIWLFAAGLTLQEQRNPGGTFGGLGLARAIKDISSGPGVILHAGQWRDLLAAVDAGATVDFDGAAGPSDFDNCGETVGPYEIYRVFKNPDTGQMTSEQIRFLSTAVIQQLRLNFTGLTNACDPI